MSGLGSGDTKEIDCISEDRLALLPTTEDSITLLPSARQPMSIGDMVLLPQSDDIVDKRKSRSSALRSRRSEKEGLKFETIDLETLNAAIDRCEFMSVASDGPNDHRFEIVRRKSRSSPTASHVKSPELGNQVTLLFLLLILMILCLLVGVGTLQAHRHDLSTLIQFSSSAKDSEMSPVALNSENNIILASSQVTTEPKFRRACWKPAGIVGGLAVATGLTLAKTLQTNSEVPHKISDTEKGPKPGETQITTDSKTETTSSAHNSTPDHPSEGRVTSKLAPGSILLGAGGTYALSKVMGNEKVQKKIIKPLANKLQEVTTLKDHLWAQKVRPGIVVSLKRMQGCIATNEQTSETVVSDEKSEGSMSVKYDERQSENIEIANPQDMSTQSIGSQEAGSGDGEKSEDIIQSGEAIESEAMPQRESPLESQQPEDPERQPIEDVSRQHSLGENATPRSESPFANQQELHRSSASQPRASPANTRQSASCPSSPQPGRQSRTSKNHLENFIHGIGQHFILKGYNGGMTLQTK